MNPIVYFNPNLPTSRAHQWNVTLEKEIMDNTVFGVSWVGTASRNLDQSYQYNAAPNAYVFYTSQGVAIPTGNNANSTRQYDQTTWNAITEYSHIGYSNYEGIRLEVLRRFTRGYAFQWYYVMANAFTSTTVNSNTSTTASLVPQDTNLYLPGAVPTDLNQLNRFLNYQRDIGQGVTNPKHHMQWNFIVDLPMGKGKWLGRNAGKAMNAVIGGWQISGTGSMVSNWNALPVNNWETSGNCRCTAKIPRSRIAAAAPAWPATSGTTPTFRRTRSTRRTRPANAREFAVFRRTISRSRLRSIRRPRLVRRPPTPRPTMYSSR